MKKLFLLILAGGIMMTACKKEEKYNTESWKTQEWQLIRQNVNINGLICNEYKNKITGQIVYEMIYSYKTGPEIKFEYKRETIYGTNNIKCDDPGNNCWKGKVDGIDVFITRRDK